MPVVHPSSGLGTAVWTAHTGNVMSLAIWSEQRAGRGEDAPPSLVLNTERGRGFMAVYDGLGNPRSARAELGCPHFAGIFALGASIELMQSIGIEKIQPRVLELNHKLTSRLDEIGWKVLSPVAEEKFRSAETLVASEDPAKLVAQLAQQNILVTEKPQGLRVSTDFFNNDDDIEKLVHRLHRFH